MAKQLAFSEEARRKLKKGIDTLATPFPPRLAPKAVTLRWTKNSVPPPSPMMV